MPQIRLPKLPDRTPVRITVSVSPDLNKALSDYASFYEKVYGRAEPVQDLIPAMLASFLEGDREFSRARRARGG